MSIYQPSEDSYFMSNILKEQILKLSDKKTAIKLLEIGSGSGIQLETASKAGIKKENILSSDINPEAVRQCKSLGFRSYVSNLFEKIRGKFDIIVFNPPYLPKSKHDKAKDTTGGKKGSEVINRFLKQAKSHLAKNGKIFLLTSSFTRGINFLNYKKKLLGKTRLFFETLYVWELIKK